MTLKRAHPLNKELVQPHGAVLYWMSRDQRVHDNWALIHAQQAAILRNVPLMVVFCLSTNYPTANIRHFDFMLKGLQEVSEELVSLEIPLFLIVGDPTLEIPKFVQSHSVGHLVTDFSPLKHGRMWRDEIAHKIPILVEEVDAHNVVPAWIASPKQEYSARTFRIKINQHLSEFLTEFPKLHRHPYQHHIEAPIVKWESVLSALKIDRTVPPVKEIIPGPEAANTTMQQFIRRTLMKYNDERNNPTVQGQSNLSPYLHFGQISSQRVALSVQKASVPPLPKEVYLEELIVRKELSDNFCFYNQNYDNTAGFPHWAQTTLQTHLSDHREFVYQIEEFERAETHDELWNAAQREMNITGKTHGYMRMYWAKKILEWTRSPEEAMEIAIYLNDKYELDGRDPNGYTGIAWSIGGVHDRPWFERSIFGKIRYMNANGAKSKFNVRHYIDQVLELTA